MMKCTVGRTSQVFTEMGAGGGKMSSLGSRAQNSIASTSGNLLFIAIFTCLAIFFFKIIYIFLSSSNTAFPANFQRERMKEGGKEGGRVGEREGNDSAVLPWPILQIYKTINHQRLPRYYGNR